MQTSILTPAAKKDALAEVRKRIDAYSADIAYAKSQIKEFEKTAKEAAANIASANKALARFEEALASSEQRYDEIKALEVTPPKVSKNGIPLGRPRIPFEEKEARKAAKSAVAPSDPVAVPEDLQPLIPNGVTSPEGGASSAD